MVPFGVTATILRAAAPSIPSFGDSNATPTENDVPGCVVWPAATAEFVVGQDTVTWDVEVLLPPDTDIRSSDKVRVSGIVYQVVGRPKVWDSQLISRRAGVQVQLKAGTG